MNNDLLLTLIVARIIVYTTIYTICLLIGIVWGGFLKIKSRLASFRYKRRLRAIKRRSL